MFDLISSSAIYSVSSSSLLATSLSLSSIPLSEASRHSTNVSGSSLVPKSIPPENSSMAAALVYAAEDDPTINLFASLGLILALSSLSVLRSSLSDCTLLLAASPSSSDQEYFSFLAPG